MKRRSFLGSTATALSAPFFLHGLAVRAYGRSPVLDALVATPCEDRVLVLVQLQGGNDGLNTVIPLDQYSQYLTVRSEIAVAEKDAVRLREDVGLHHAMTGMAELFTYGKLRIIQNVGYPVPNFSHFRSTDIWLTASDEDETVDSGWMGRYLERRFEGYPTGFPNATMPDPLAIHIGTSASFGLEGTRASMGMAFSDPSTYYNISNAGKPIGSSLGQRAQDELRHIRSVGTQIANFAAPVKEASLRANNKSPLYPEGNSNPLANQLRIVARLIAGGLRSKIYIVNQLGYDTHAYQATGGPGTPYPHGVLLAQLSEALTAFQDDLRLLGIEDKVLGMTFSEFGRRVVANGSAGTDHGAAAPMFFFGTTVEPGILGDNPVIPDDASPEDNVPMQYDFRSVYRSILTDWFCLPEATAREVLFREFSRVQIVRGSDVTSVFENLANPAWKVSISPQPVSTSAEITLVAPSGPITISIFDSTGRRLAVTQSEHGGGVFHMTLDVTALPSGRMTLNVAHSEGVVVHGFIVHK